MPDDQQYTELFDTIIQRHIDMFGSKIALMAARQAPLEVDQDGRVQGFYGDGMDALDILTEQFIDLAGEAVALNRIRKIVSQELDEEEYDNVPERIRPQSSAGKDEHDGFLSRLRASLLS